MQQGVDLTVATVDGSWGMGESDRRLPAARAGVRLTNDSQMRLEPVKRCS